MLTSNKINTNVNKEQITEKTNNIFVEQLNINNNSKNEEEKISEMIKSLNKEGSMFDEIVKSDTHIGKGKNTFEEININESNFGNIQQNELTNFMQNTIGYKTDMYISFNNKNERFYLYDYNQTTIGSFSIEEVIKYIVLSFNAKVIFMPYIDNKQFNRSVNLIKLYIVNININKDIKYIDIKLHDYQTSPFMCDIEMLIRFNKLLYKFEQEQLDKELQHVDKKYNDEIKFNIQKFIYMMYSYTLQLLANISDDIKNNQDIDQKMKYNIIKYSIDLTNKISQFVQNQSKRLSDKIMDVNNILSHNKELKKTIEKKIDNIIDNIQYNIKKEQIGGSIEKKLKQEIKELRKDVDNHEADIQELKEDIKKDVEDIDYSITSDEDDMNEIYEL